MYINLQVAFVTNLLQLVTKTIITFVMRIVNRFIVFFTIIGVFLPYYFQKFVAKIKHLGYNMQKAIVHLIKMSSQKAISDRKEMTK